MYQTDNAELQLFAEIDELINKNLEKEFIYFFTTTQTTLTFFFTQKATIFLIRQREFILSRKSAKFLTFLKAALIISVQTLVINIFSKLSRINADSHFTLLS